jgi:hypothetical protein
MSNQQGTVNARKNESLLPGLALLTADAPQSQLHAEALSTGFAQKTAG